MQSALALMQNDLEYAQQEKVVKQTRADGKKMLAEIAVRNEVPGGMRWGQLAVYYRGEKTTKTLDQDKLWKILIEELEVNPVELEQARVRATKESAPWLDLQVKDLSPKIDNKGAY